MSPITPTIAEICPERSPSSATVRAESLTETAIWLISSTTAATISPPWRDSSPERWASASASPALRAILSMPTVICSTAAAMLDAASLWHWDAT